MRRLALVATLLLVLGACGDDDATDTTVVASTTSIPATTPTTSTTTAPATTTTADTGTTRTSFDNPPGTAPDPERGQFVGIWRWANTHTRYIELFEHGVIGAGAIVEGTLQLNRTGDWEVSDGVMTITQLELGPDPCGDAVGTYAIRIAGSNLVMDLVDDPCEGRAVWLIGRGETRRTWFRDDGLVP